ncbi:aldehyde dehydrogenase family protein [Novosphingobium sp.]|uniref:aldehyde dehydrogenase family protein n=1 Tax=Novosphingobium sp. TaxID=1874826 RepID=UPI0031D7B0BF
MSDARSYNFEAQYIAGTWRAGTGETTATDLNPYTGETLLTLKSASIADVDAAYRAAEAAQVAWAETSPAARADLFRRVADILRARREEIVEWLIKEAGSARLKAQIEWQAVLNGVIEAASIPYRMHGQILPIDTPDTESRVYRRPIGVVGVISPWNFPFHLSHRSIAPALATGNAVVVKPAEDTPVTGGLLIARIYEEAGLPAGLLNVVTGDSRTIGDSFCTHDAPRFLSFTGSTGVGRRIGRLAIEAPVIKRTALELGGNNPLVVLADADLEQAAQAAAFGRFLHQGQICMSTNRIIVDASVYDEFLTLFVDYAGRLQHGDPADANTLVGPALNAKQLKANLEHLADAKSRLRQVLGGDPVGSVVPPHIFADVDNDDPLAQTEMFAPIAFVIKARDDAHALELANGTEAGLSSAVFSQDEARALRFARGIDAGMTHINDMTVADVPFNPFGGEKNSGLGRFGGSWIVDELTTTHWITVRRGKISYIH